MANTLKIKRGTAATIPQGQLAEPLFTTDTYDLYIGKGSGGNQRIQNYIASGTSSQFLKGDGTLDSTSYEPLITAGTTLQYYRGDKTFQTLDTSVVPENGPIYFTEPRVRATVLTGLNLSGGGTIAATDSILTAFGKVQNQISALVGGATYQGTWNASTNTPTLASGTGTKGYYYVVSVAGSTNLDGITDWKVGDWAIFNGTTWDKVDNTDAVSSVNGFTGAVNLGLGNISDVSAASPTNAQLLRFNGTSSLWENWTPTFEPALTKGNLTEATSSVLTITGGTGAVIGSGTTIAVAQASGSTSGYLSSTDWTTFNNKQAALTNPVTGTGTNNYIPKFTATGSTIGDSSLYYGEGANFNEYTFGSIGAGSKFNNSNYNILSNSNASIYLQFGSNKYVQLYNLFGDVGLSVANTGVHSTFSMIYFNGTGTQYTAIYSPGGEGLRVKSDATLRLTQYTSNGFLKTSGGDGTLSVDTTSYLPLTGGTLTGALSGTSATFSGDLLVKNTSTLARIDIEAPSANSKNIFFKSTGNADNSVRLAQNANTNDFIIATGDGTVTPTTRLTIASTGAATFTGRVSAGGSMLLGEVQSSYSLLETTAGNGIWLRPAGIASPNGLFVNTSGNVGIGTTSPTDLIHAAAGTAAGLSLQATGTGGSTWRILSTDNAASISGGKIGFNNGSYRMVIDGSGNVGIGTTSPSKKLEIVDTSDQLRLSYDATTFTDIRTDSAGGLLIKAANSYIINYINGTERMRITSGGNVGIGTTSPGTLLHLQNSSGPTLRLVRTSNRFDISADNDFMELNARDASTYMIFKTADTERMRITSGGEILINTTTDSGDYKLQVSGNSYVSGSMSVGTNTLYANNVFLIRGTGTTSGGYALSIQDSNGADIADFRNDKVCRFYSEVYTGGSTDNGAYNLQCNGTGVWGAGAYVNGSDIRLKENIKPILTGLEYVSKMNPVSFNYIKSYSKDQNIQTGFIAQDLKELFKNEEWVNGIVCEGKEFYNVAYQNIIPILTKAIQELKFELDTLKNK